MDEAEKKSLYDPVLASIRTDLSRISLRDPAAVYKTVVDHLSGIPYFYWIGIYLYNNDTRELYLGIYAGRNMKMALIPVLKGICGNAVAHRKNTLVNDVSEEKEPLVSSPDTKAEIVVMLSKDNRVTGIIDVESDKKGIFDDIDLNTSK